MQAIKGLRLKFHYARAFGHKAPVADVQNSVVVPTLETPAFIDLATLAGKKHTLRSQNKRGQFNSAPVVFPLTLCSVNYRNSQSHTIRAAGGDGSALKNVGSNAKQIPSK